MYRPQDISKPQYPVFIKINGRIISFLSLKGALLLAASVVLALVLNSFMDLFTHPVEVSLSASEQSTQLTALKQERAACVQSSLESQLEPYLDETGEMKDGLTEAQRSEFLKLKSKLASANMLLGGLSDTQVNTLIDQAQADGISESTSDTELESKVTSTRTEYVAAIEFPVRLALFVFVIGLTFLLVAEFGGSISLLDQLLESRKNATRAHVYIYQRYI